ncbi:MAG: hypothetical protein LBI56_01535 [Puniceicoccales bacterium]|jgi:hypothetical protein|nr:hypothetical protein [Puniceicoccales bacterium]
MPQEIVETITNGNLASIFFLVTATLWHLRGYICSPRALFGTGWAIRISSALFLAFSINILSEVQRPLWVLLAILLLLLFLCESIRIWALTGIFTRIDIPIFPKFRQCTENFIWPIGKFFDDIRELIISRGFKEKALLKLGGGDIFVIYSPIFYSDDHRSRLQVIFDSFQRERIVLNCVLTSYAKNGEAIVTNNLRTVFASFYPKSWNIKRFPMASLEELFDRHARRIRDKKILKIDDNSSWEAINSEHHQIELENCRAGLCEKLDGNDHITLTFFGRYQLWRDMLIYAFLGKNI